MRASLFLLSLLVAAASAGVTRTLTTLQVPEDTPSTTPTSTTTTSTSSTSSSTPSEPRTEEEEEEEEDTEERRVGVNGWLAAPTQAPATSSPQTEAPEKPGVCESPKGYGIRCMTRMDQCKNDKGCPAATKCCVVGECGKMCVKPKPTSTDTKEATKATVKKNKGAKESNKQEKEEEEGVVAKEDEEPGQIVEEVQEEEWTADVLPLDVQTEEGENQEAENGQVTHETPLEEENVTSAAPTDVESS